MFQFIVIIIFMFALGTTLYLVVRALPRIDERRAAHSPTTMLERWITSEMPEKIDRTVNAFFGKFIRRLKIVLMRIDNVLTERLKKIKTEEGNGAASKGFGGIVENKEEKDNNRGESRE